MMNPERVFPERGLSLSPAEVHAKSRQANVLGILRKIHVSLTGLGVNPVRKKHARDSSFIIHHSSFAKRHYTYYFTTPFLL
ncbi:MAG TPA: hypothetical protein ENJ53_02350 [Phaeodactylibacter sp.]|nr:hypothetical protein [Phaeodactylibacter sp.]